MSAIAMGYCPRVRRHLPTRFASVRSSDSRVESDQNDHQETASDMGSCSVDVLPGPSTAPPALAATHETACTARPALSEKSTPMPRDKSESISGRTRVIPDNVVDGDVAQDWECVRSLRQLSLSTNADSECGIEDWASGCTSYAGVMDTWGDGDDECEAKSWTPDKGDDPSHAAHRWDLIPEYLKSPGVRKDTLFLRMHGRPLDSRRAPPERSTHRSARSRTLNAVPHRQIHIPLLSALVSLLSIDDETFHLVTHLPAHSALFPGPINPSDEEIDKAQEIHGLHALLSRHGVLREGLAVACDESVLSSNPFWLSASPLFGLLDIVRGLFVGGSAALN
jgi:hypothetical protein